MSFEVHLEGEAELMQTLDKLSRALLPNEVEPVLLKGAQTIRDDVKARAPHGPTGNLRRSPVAKVLRRDVYLPPVAIAAVNRKRAPHAWLVENGTQGDRIGQKGRYKGRHFGKMPANPFFENAVRANYERAVQQIVNELSNKVDGALE